MTKVAVCVGHNSKAQGAMGNMGVSEYILNSAIANIIKQRLKDSDIQVKIFHRRPYKSYRRQMIRLANEVNAFDPCFAIEMHFNAGNSKARGHEALYWHTSNKGRKIAFVFNQYFGKYLNTRDRGIKPLTKADRGARFTYSIKAPAIICEPFFAGNEDYILNDRFEALVTAYVEAIKFTVKEKLC